MMTPRQLAGWFEVYKHEDAAYDARMITLMRVAQHSDKKGFDKFMKTLERQV